MQGEGLHTGIPMYFIRLQGCEVGCYFCDTKYTWRKTTKPEQMQHERDIAERAFDSGTKWACITGGEPYEQELESLANQLHRLGMNVQVETSGTVWQDLELDWITLSPKDLFSKKKTLDYFGVDANEIKCVVTKDSDVDYYLDTYGIFCNDAKPIIFQLVDNDTSLIPMVLEKIRGFSDVRIMIQQHKLMDLR